MNRFTTNDDTKNSDGITQTDCMLFTIRINQLSFTEDKKCPSNDSSNLSIILMVSACYDYLYIKGRPMFL